MATSPLGLARVELAASEGQADPSELARIVRGAVEKIGAEDERLGGSPVGGEPRQTLGVDGNAFGAIGGQLGGALEGGEAGRRRARLLRSSPRSGVGA